MFPVHISSSLQRNCTCQKHSTKSAKQSTGALANNAHMTSLVWALNDFRPSQPEFQSKRQRLRKHHGFESVLPLQATCLFAFSFGFLALSSDLQHYIHQLGVSCIMPNREAQETSASCGTVREESPRPTTSLILVVASPQKTRTSRFMEQTLSSSYAVCLFNAHAGGS